MGMCAPKGMVFQPFWSEIGYGFVHCSLELGMFFRRISYFFMW